MNGHNLPPVPDLSQRQGVQINSAIIVPAAAIDFLPGSLSHFGGGYHIRLLDMQKGVAQYIPASDRFLRAIQSQITQLLEGAGNGAEQGH